MTCDGKGQPVQGCSCLFCRRARPTRLQPAEPERERIALPSGDFLEEDGEE